MCGNIRVRVVHGMHLLFYKNSTWNKIYFFRDSRRCLHRVREILCVHEYTSYFIRAFRVRNVCQKNLHSREPSLYPTLSSEIEESPRAPCGYYFVMTRFVIPIVCKNTRKRVRVTWTKETGRCLLWQWENLSIACNLRNHST